MNMVFKELNQEFPSMIKNRISGKIAYPELKSVKSSLSMTPDLNSGLFNILKIGAFALNYSLLIISATHNK